MPYRVSDLYEQHKDRLGLELVSGHRGMNRHIKVPEAHRPGLSLAGYFKSHAGKRILIFGKVEIEFLRDLEPELRVQRLRAILDTPVPAVIVARHYSPPKELLKLCEEYAIPLFRASMITMNLLSKLTLLLVEEFAPKTMCHGTLVEVFGLGLLIQGESSIGKSEAALGLLERGHRLITDDVVFLRVRESTYLEGYGAELTRHHMEIRGIGIINVANLYGAVCVRNDKAVDMIVRLEVWDDTKHYDRLGLHQEYSTLLGIDVPFRVLPVKPGRDVVMLLETLALTHRLNAMGYNSAQEFNTKLLDEIKKKVTRRPKSGRL